MQLSDFKTIAELISYICDIWKTKTGLLLALIFIISSYLCFDINTIINIIKAKNQYTTLFFLFILLFTILIWVKSNRIKSRKKGTIGVALAIYTENSEMQQKLKSDLIDTLSASLSSINKIKFDIIILTDSHSKKIIENQDFQTIKYYHQKTQSHLLLFGKCVVRKHKSEECYLIELRASIVHKLVPDIIQKILASEMNKVIPNNNIFPINDELLNFKVTSQNIKFAVEYIVGLAALISQNIEFAFELHYNNLYQELKQLKDNNNNNNYIEEIFKLLPTKIIDEAMFLVSKTYQHKQENYLNSMKYYLDILNEFDPNNYNAHLLRGIYFFLSERNIKKAQEEIKLSKNKIDASWQYSDAFLHAYNGNLKKAHQIYKRAFEGNAPPHIPLTVEEFITDIIELEKDKTQLYYCLGLINYFDKKDLKLAEDYFKRFIETNKNNDLYKDNITFSLQYLDEINQKNQ